MGWRSFAPAIFNWISSASKVVSAPARLRRYSMIHAADNLGVIENLPPHVDEWDHDVCCCLISDAQVVLRKAIERAQAVQ